MLTVDDAVLFAAAKRYLQSSDAGGEAWLDQPGRLPFQAFVGYVALASLAREPDADVRLDAVPQEVWQRWIPTILWFFDSLGDAAVGTVLKSKAQQHAPESYRHWALRRVEVEVAAGWSVDPLDHLAAAVDDDAETRLDTVLRSTFDTVTGIVAELGLTAPLDEQQQAPRPSTSELRSRLSIARGNAVRLARVLVPRHEATRLWLRNLADGTTSAPLEVRVLATQVLLAQQHLGWDEVLAAMQADDDFGVALAVALAPQRGDDIALPQLTEGQLTSLWSWLDAHWSSDTDTYDAVTDDEHVRDWRDGLVAELQARATPDALTALAALAAGRPDDYRLQAALADAEVRDHDSSWQAVTVAELTALLSNARRTLVNDDDDLYRAVLASLDRFADRMRSNGESLWNETRPASDGHTGKKVWNPKYEPALSTALQDHLRQEFGDQLVVNREVLVKPTTSKGHGLSVDVLPTGTEAADGRHLPRCPIEVKGCWNGGLLTDLKDQLVDDYLPAAQATRGIYICGWFPLEQWDDLADPRRRVAASRQRDDVAASLAEAAHTASAAGNIEVAAVIIDVPRPAPSQRSVSATPDEEQTL